MNRRVLSPPRRAHGSRIVATGAAKCRELPLTDVIGGSSPSTMEARYAAVRAATHELPHEFARPLDLAQLPRRRAADALARAARQMTDVDLDVAWEAALRGDSALLHARIAPCVDLRPQRRTPEGSPWRTSGWLRRRAR